MVFRNAGAKGQKERLGQSIVCTPNSIVHARARARADHSGVFLNSMDNRENAHGGAGQVDAVPRFSSCRHEGRRSQVDDDLSKYCCAALLPSREQNPCMDSATFSFGQVGTKKKNEKPKLKMANQTARWKTLGEFILAEED